MMGVDRQPKGELSVEPSAGKEIHLNVRVGEDKTRNLGWLVEQGSYVSMGSDLVDTGSSHQSIKALN